MMYPSRIIYFRVRGGLSRGYIDSGRRLARVPVRFMPAPRAGACAPTYKRVPPPRRPGLLRVRVTVRAPAEGAAYREF